ncbi:MAG: hypothetical protein JXM79_08710 [Sedimentisphaerales bacterium]|nr:hypothetical protein [Sedimentisphaerales bacterium]
MPEGECRVWAGSDEYAYYQETEPIGITKEKVTRQEIHLNRNPHVSGIVYAQDGRPATGVIVASKPVFNKADRTDADGRFEMSWYSRSNIK